MKDSKYYRKIASIALVLGFVLLALFIATQLFIFVGLFVISYAVAIAVYIKSSKLKKVESQPQANDEQSDSNAFTKYVAGPTPNGDHAIMYYYDADGKPCTIDEAVKIIIDEFDKDGKVVMSTTQFRQGAQINSADGGAKLPPTPK